MKPEIIFEKAHLEESSQMAREYFAESELTMHDLTIARCQKLSELITDEINILLADKSYSMIRELRMVKRIQKNKEEIHLLTAGSYFDKRHAISFYFKDRIIFCPWASGCNRIPYIKGFVKWCDWMKLTLLTDSKVKHGK